jgi:hypothetical protein
MPSQLKTQNKIFMILLLVGVVEAKAYIPATFSGVERERISSPAGQDVECLFEK